MPGDNPRLVYSTEGGRVPAEGRPRPARQKAASVPQVPDDGIIRLHRAKAGKGGKAAMLITGLPGSDTELDALLKQLKQALGTGGSREGRVLAVQGDQRDKLRAKLEGMGYRVKLAGG